MRNKIKQLIASIQPLDSTEADHIADTVAWIDSGAEIFRIEKPAVPPKHLVSCFVLIDPDKNKVMLVDHKKAELWLPAGGHVEKDEHPNTTVEREILEELNLPADFINTEPLFITQVLTVGKTPGHTDVNLWYVLRGNSEKGIACDPREFNGHKWFTPKEILSADLSKFDMHMHRFVKKLLANNLVKSHA